MKTLKLACPVALLLVLALAASAQAAVNRSFQHDLNRVNGHLRIAIEYAPLELGESLRAAEVVCGLGEAALAKGDAEHAAGDWTTLDQLVGEAARRQARRIEVAFANADTVVRDLRRRYERRWATIADRLRELRRGVEETRRGIVVMREAVAALAGPFASWQAHECEAAGRGREEAFGQIGSGLQRINVGMLRLWRLSRPGSDDPGV
jgi:Arc/MetJ-type ribon-helix-helix transcriptional regulator